MIVFQHTEHVAPQDVDTEDGGAAKIFTVSSSGKSHMFVRVQSYDDDFMDGKVDRVMPIHPEFDRILGKKIRVTVEVLG